MRMFKGCTALLLSLFLQTLQGAGAIIGNFPVPIVRALAILQFKRCDLCRRQRPVTTSFAHSLGIFAHEECLEKALACVPPLA